MKGFSFFKNRELDVRSRDIDKHEIGIFMEISAQYAHLNGENERRADLYENWFKCSPRAFRVLEYQDLKKKKPVVVAISIIVPLTKQGEEQIRKDHSDAYGIRDGDVAQRLNKNYDCILLDSLIVNKKFKRNRYAYVTKLLTDHMYQLLGEKTKHDLKIYTEPDLYSVIKLLEKLHFKKLTKSGEPLYYRCVPSNLIINDFEGIYNQVLHLPY